jgi:inosose dehydratase
MIKVANAPCSWGALEFDLEGKTLGYEQVLREMKETGFEGTELGDWGFMPTDPVELKNQLGKRQLQLLGAFVPVALKDPEAHRPGIELALKTAGLMFNAGFKNAFIVLADDNGTIPERTGNAGRVTPEMGLSRDQWKRFAGGAEKIAREVKEAYDMRTVFHHHCAGYVETPAEIDMLMSLTDPSLLGLCLDTGHYAFGGGDPVEALKKYYQRIWHVHFKDFEPGVGKEVERLKLNYFQSVEKGVFCELGKGSVHFKEILNVLNDRGYNGWIVVEQDVLPGMGEPKKCADNNRRFLHDIGI